VPVSDPTATRSGGISFSVTAKQIWHFLGRAGCTIATTFNPNPYDVSTGGAWWGRASFSGALADK
jgi:hypothetical protein